MRRRAQGLGILIALITSVSHAGNRDWPAWRGDGSGVSMEADLPVEWSPDNNLLWKTRIPGRGISSPIVWENRVIVTTAVEGRETDALRILVAAIVGALVLAGLVWAAIAFRRGYWSGRLSTGLPLWLRAVNLVDMALLVVATLALVPTMVTLLLPGDRHLLVIGQLSRFVDPPPGNTLRLWLASGVVAALALIVATSHFRPRSRGRVLGAVLLLAAAGLFYTQTPLDQHTREVAAPVRLAVCAPAAIAALWFLLIYVLTRRPVDETGGASRNRWLVPAAAVLAGACAFAYANYLQPQSGLWRSVVCLDLDTGIVLWERRAFIAAAGRKYRHNSYATPTPVTDGEYLLAHFGSGMAMMDLEGEIKWMKRVAEFDQHLRYGAGSSPVMHGNLVIDTFMAEGGFGVNGLWEGRFSYLRGLEKATGAEVWRVSPLPSAHDSYNTPVIVRDGDRSAVVLSTYDHGLAYDAATGESLWWVELPVAQPVPSIVADDHNVYLTGGLHGPQVAAAIRLGGVGNVTDTHVKWTITKGTPDSSSPVLYRGLLYWVTENGIVNCVDAETGESVWRHRIEGRFLASPVVGAGNIYFPATDGTVTVIEAGREFNLLSVNATGEPMYASPAISRGRILLRGEEHLFCYLLSHGSRPDSELTAGEGEGLVD